MAFKNVLGMETEYYYMLYHFHFPIVKYNIDSLFPLF